MPDGVRIEQTQMEPYQWRFYCQDCGCTGDWQFSRALAEAGWMAHLEHGTCIFVPALCCPYLNAHGEVCNVALDHHAANLHLDLWLWETFYQKDPRRLINRQVPSYSDTSNDEALNLMQEVWKRDPTATIGQDKIYVRHGPGGDPQEIFTHAQLSMRVVRAAIYLASVPDTQEQANQKDKS